MKIKVCGIKVPEQEIELQIMGVDMIGLNFFAGSPRFVGGVNFGEKQMSRAGVFVNASKPYILEMIDQFELDIIQLHGHETGAFCEELLTYGQVIKATGIEDKTDLEELDEFPEDVLLLLDNKSPKFGGTGQRFDWDLLEKFPLKRPFLLAGGIRTSDAVLLNKLKLKNCIGYDLNSQFEISPGVKDIQMIKEFIAKINHQHEL